MKKIIAKNDRQGGSFALGYCIKGFLRCGSKTFNKWKKGQKINKKSKFNRLLIRETPSDFFVKSKMFKRDLFSDNPTNLSYSSRFRKQIPDKYRNLDSTALKKLCEKISKKYTDYFNTDPRLVTLLFPNDAVVGNVKDFSTSKTNIVVGAYRESYREKSWDFYDDVKSKYKYDLRISLPVYEYKVMIDGVLSVLYSEQKLLPEKRYLMTVYRWNEPVDSAVGVVKDVPVYYCFKARQFKEDFSMLFDVGENINDFMTLTPNWLYDEETTALLLFNLLYVSEGEPVLNTVLFGNTRTGKSRVLDVFANLFNEKKHSGSTQTIKGLTGSFYGDRPQMGSMMESNFIHLNDEFFRTGASAKQQGNHIVNLLNAVIEMFEHTKKTTSSGKFNRLINFDKSFLGTNNVKDMVFFRKAFEEDPALFNRITLLKLPKKVEDRIRNGVQVSPSFYYSSFVDRLLKAGLNAEIYRKMFVYMRQNLYRVKVDGKKVADWARTSEYCHEDFTKQEKMTALVKCVVMFRYVFENDKPFPITKDIVATSDDYKQAVKYMNRIVKDFKQVCQQQ